MTARETLHEAARLLECAHDYHVVPVHHKAATALRSLADRLDAEMRAVLAMEQETRDTNDASGWGAAAAIAQSLARLDAPLGEPKT